MNRMISRARGYRNTTMKRSKRRRLEKKGWRLGDPADFLRLSDREAALIELKLKLSHPPKDKRLPAAKPFL
jgi:hypothetical protein